MLVSDNKTKEFYEKLENVEGYIQLSGKKLDIFDKEKILPSWESLHDNKNFILEACFFDDKENKTISIKQINNSYIFFEKKLSDEDIQNANIYKAKENKKVKIAQIWEEIEDENCNSLNVLKPKYQVFAGFEKGQSK